MPYTVMPNASMSGWAFVLHTTGLRSEVVCIVRGEEAAERVAGLLNAHGMVAPAELPGM